MLIMGIDPDTHTTGFAYRQGARFTRVGVLTCRSDLRALSSVNSMIRGMRKQATDMQLPYPDILGVEVMELYAGKSAASRHQRPQDIVNLNLVAGACASLFFNHPEGREADRLYLLPPKIWKGQVPKAIHHIRLVQKLGWNSTLGDRGPTNIEPDYHIPGWDELGRGHQGHVLDAMGIALYLQESLVTQIEPL